MRTLSGTLQTAYGAPVQKPAWLVEIVMPLTTYRLCSYDNVTWNSQLWTANNLDVSGLRVGALSIRGSLICGNADDVFGSLVLNDTITDRPIRIWGYDASIASPAANDPVLVADAVGAGASVTDSHVRIDLRDASEYRLGPRAIVSPSYGFNALLPAGRTLVINGISYTVQRGR